MSLSFVRHGAAMVLLPAAGALLAGIVFANSVFAAEPQRGAITACAPDLAKFCPGIEAGGGKKMRCLIDNRASLSAECAGAVTARQALRPGGAVMAQAPGAVSPPPPAGQPSGQPPGTMAPPVAAPPVVAPPAASLPKASPLQANMRACRTDMATFCGAVEKGGGRRVKCLLENQAKLGPDCASAIASAHAQKQASKSACEGDVAKLCAAARGPARRQCLDANRAQLTPACADVLAARAAKQDKRAAAPPKQ